MADPMTNDSRSASTIAAEEFHSLRPPHDLTRRGFVKTSLAAGFAAAVLPVQAQTMITTDAKGLNAGEVKIPVRDGDMPAYRAAPASRSGLATILVVQEVFGVHEHIKDVCRRFAKQGYLAVAPELYARQGDPSKYTDIPKLLAEIVSKVPDQQVMSDLDATAAWAIAHGGDASKCAITGFCWGGRIVWLYAAHNPRLLAGVAWYGRLAGDATALTPKHPIDIAATLRVPVLGLYGGADPGIPADSIEAMRASLKDDRERGNQSEFVVYPDTPHAFFADYRPSYRKEAAEDGWTRCLAWLRKYGVS
jgi:carboxymethylenebutenolidase